MAPVDNIETYCEQGIWMTRWQHSTAPFASGGSKERQISQGATVAQWYGVDHIIKAPDGTIDERNSYRAPTGHAIDHHDTPTSAPTRRRARRSATTGISSSQ